MGAPLLACLDQVRTAEPRGRLPEARRERVDGVVVSARLRASERVVCSLHRRGPSTHLPGAVRDEPRPAILED